MNCRILIHPRNLKRNEVPTRVFTLFHTLFQPQPQGVQTSRFPYPLILVPAPFRWLLSLYLISTAKHYTTLCNLGHFSRFLTPWGSRFLLPVHCLTPLLPFPPPSPKPLLLLPTFCSSVFVIKLESFVLLFAKIIRNRSQKITFSVRNWNVLSHVYEVSI